MAEADRKLQAGDYQGIRQTSARWNYSLSFGDPDGFARCFTADGLLSVSGAWTEDIFGGSHRGTLVLRSYADRINSTFGEGAFRFWTSLPLIEGAGDEATLQSYLLVLAPNDHGAATIGSGMVNDQLRCMGGEWLIEFRNLEIEHLDHGDWIEGVMAGLVHGGAYVPTPEFWSQGFSNSEPGQALDYELILQTQARYGLAWDFNDAEGWAHLFTEDGTFRVIGLDHLYKSASWHEVELPTVHTGRQALAAFGRAAQVNKSPGRERHWINPPFISIHGDRAIAYAQLTTRTAGAFDQCRALVTAVYVDRLRKVDDQWLFEERSATSEFSSERLPDYEPVAHGRYVASNI